MEKIKYLCKNKDEGKRLDVLLIEILKDKSRSYVQDMISSEEVYVNKKIKKQSYKIKENDLIELTLNDPVELLASKQDIPIDILYEDEWLIIINKEQGMVVHPAPGNYDGTVVNAILHHCEDKLSGINGIMRPGIVHRIDKNTSGLIVVAKNDKAHISLSKQFKEHTIKRRYVALVEGVIKDDSGTIDKPIGRDVKQRIKMAICQNGRNAITHFKVLKVYDNYSLIECILETGRTHQIRVHMSSIGHPVVGDDVYGFKKQKFKLNGQLLHAKDLGFYHPEDGRYIEFSSELPKYFKDILCILERNK